MFQNKKNISKAIQEQLLYKLILIIFLNALIIVHICGIVLEIVS